MVWEICRTGGHGQFAIRLSEEAVVRPKGTADEANAANLSDTRCQDDNVGLGQGLLSEFGLDLRNGRTVILMIAWDVDDRAGPLSEWLERAGAVGDVAC